MKRSGPIQRKTPMPRGSWKKAAPAPRASLKPSRPKMTPIRKAARGEDCTLLFPGACNQNSETTVLCHSPFLKDGRGMGLKSPDERACFGCSACHDILDARAHVPGLTRELIELGFEAAVVRTHARLRAKGIAV